MKMYCITLNDNHYKKIKDLGYIPVGLGKEIKSENFKEIILVKIFQKKSILW